MANAIAKASASAQTWAIAKSTFCFLHSPANIQVHSSVGGRSRTDYRSVPTRRQRFIRRSQRAGHALSRSQDFLSVDVRMHRQRQRRVRQRFACREITRPVTEICERGLKMQRDRVMDSAFDVGLQKRVPDGIASSAPNDEQVVAGFQSFGFEDRLSVHRREQLAISRRYYAAALVPFGELFQFRAQNRSLDRIETRVVAANLVGIVRQSSVI